MKDKRPIRTIAGAIQVSSVALASGVISETEWGTCLGAGTQFGGGLTRGALLLAKYP